MTSAARVAPEGAAQ